MLMTMSLLRHASRASFRVALVLALQRIFFIVLAIVAADFSRASQRKHLRDVLDRSATNTKRINPRTTSALAAAPHRMPLILVVAASFCYLLSMPPPPYNICMRHAPRRFEFFPVRAPMPFRCASSHST